MRVYANGAFLYVLVETPGQQTVITISSDIPTETLRHGLHGGWSPHTWFWDVLVAFISVSRRSGTAYHGRKEAGHVLVGVVSPVGGRFIEPQTEVKLTPKTP